MELAGWGACVVYGPCPSHTHPRTRDVGHSAPVAQEPGREGVAHVFWRVSRLVDVPCPGVRGFGALAAIRIGSVQDVDKRWPNWLTPEILPSPAAPAGWC